MKRKSQAKPRLWIVAGPNGSGKSTIYGQSDITEFDGSVWIINPDLLTGTLLASEQLDQQEANLQAVKRIEAWLRQSIRVYQTIGVETVLSTGKYRKLVRYAKRHGFEIRLIYVLVDSVERQLERIRLRVAKGGHDVPADKVAERRSRSLAQLNWFFWAADEAWVYDNSHAEPALMAHRGGASGWISANATDEFRQAVFG